jgi:hypothetical protein
VENLEKQRIAVSNHPEIGVLTIKNLSTIPWASISKNTTMYMMAGIRVNENRNGKSKTNTVPGNDIRKNIGAAASNNGNFTKLSPIRTPMHSPISHMVASK